jgi:hypothetical protein
MISLVFLVLILAYRPYCTDGLNQLQAGCLLVNVFTLFVGIMLIITTQLEDAAKRAEEEFDGSERDAISVIVFIANLFTILLPILQEMPRSKLKTVCSFSRDLFEGLETPSTNSFDVEKGIAQGPVAAVDLTATRPDGWRTNAENALPFDQQQQGPVAGKVSRHEIPRQSAKGILYLDELPSRTPSERNSRASRTHELIAPRPPQPVARDIDMTPAFTDYEIRAASPHVDQTSTKQSKAASVSKERDPAPSRRNSRASPTGKFVPNPVHPPQAVARVTGMAPAVADYEITAAARFQSLVPRYVDLSSRKQSKAANEVRDPAPSGHSSRASLTRKFVASRPPARRQSQPVTTDIDTVSAVADYEITAAVMRPTLVSPHVDRPRKKQIEAASMMGDICWARQPPP